ncbi:MAG: lepB [Firmicutes bacterium]|nr:lepB [Bacillota bacterium]
MPVEGGEPQPHAVAGNEEGVGPVSGLDPVPVASPGPDQAPPRGPRPPSGKSIAREWLETIIVALLAALLIRALVVQVYLVEGESMEPTLHTAERLLVNKFVYRFHPPTPGDIVVLQDPSRTNRELIKRVVAVSGETVEVKQGTVYVNGQALQEPYKNTDFALGPDAPPQVVPPNSIFVMGDNRARSLDSRMIGFIPDANVDGKAFFLFWPLSRLGAGPLDYPRTPQQTGVTK